MKPWLLLICAGCLLSGTVCFAANAADDDDDEYEEVVVRRKKKKKSPAKPAKKDQSVQQSEVVAPVAVAPAVIVPAAVVVAPVATPTATVEPTVEPAADEPPPPPEPPAADAAEPRRLVRYFCKAWKDKDYERLWWAMSPQYRKKVSLKKFGKLFDSDAETNGGLVDENIIETAKTRRGNEGVKVELIFKFPKAQHRFVMAEAERQPGGLFRLVDSPFIPRDLDDF